MATTVLTKNSVKNGVYETETCNGSFICVTFRFQNVLEVAQASGEHEKIMQGLYENYLESKAKDPRMEGVSILSKRINNLLSILASSLLKTADDSTRNIWSIWLKEII